MAMANRGSVAQGLIAHPEAGLERPELERPGLAGRTLWVGTRLLAACTLFYFLGFVFADVYLKTLNTNGAWRTTDEKPSVLIGTVVLLLVVAAVGAFTAGTRSFAASRFGAWRLGAGAALALGLAAVVVQVVQLFFLDFGYGDSGYASVFAGWQWSLVVALLFGFYAVATLLAQSVRVPPETRLHVPDLTSPAALVPTAEAVRYMLVVLAAVELLAWVLLYLVR